MNDYLDRDRDVRVHRADKPVVAGTLAPATLRTATAVAAVAVVPLSLLSGWLAGSLHLVAVASAWSYNLWLKATALSVLPYAVSFGLLPAFVTAGLPGHPVYGWLVAAGALLGAGAHFANVLPDIDDDLATGVRGLPHRLGATGSRIAAGTLLAAASLVLAVGPPGPPGVLGDRRRRGRRAGAAVGAGVLGRRPGSRAAFLGVLVVAAVDVGAAGRVRQRLALTCAGRPAGAPLGWRPDVRRTTGGRWP